MKRFALTPRDDWQSKVEAWGLLYHTHEGVPYWNESACYELTDADVEALESATNELHAMCLKAVDEVIRTNRFVDLRIPATAVEALKLSRRVGSPSLYGRFDLAYDGSGPPKLLEYNADTPTALLEAAVVQWQWSQDLWPGCDQFNSIWEALILRWTWLKSERFFPSGLVHFAHGEDWEDLLTVSLLRDTAVEAGLTTEGIHVGDIGWNASKSAFVDLQERRMECIFKLYPWEWMLGDEFGKNVVDTIASHVWIEPLWKSILSNKAILAILWEMFPNHPNLLPAYLDGPREMTSFVKKPIYSREGANIDIVSNEASASTGGEYGAEGHVYQQFQPIAAFDGRIPVIGSWVVGDESCGVGIRESVELVTTNLSQFVPHIIGE